MRTRWLKGHFRISNTGAFKRRRWEIRKCPSFSSVVLWLIPLLLLATCLYALAEEVTLVTTYPSPRGVYKDLKAVANVTIGTFRHTPKDATDTEHEGKLVVAGTPQDPVSSIECPTGTDWYDEDTDGAREAQECKPTGLLVTPSGTVGIGTITPPASALLDLSSATQGLLPPRINRVSDTDPIANPAVGLLIFNTDPAVNAFEYWDGTAWKPLGSGLQSGDVAAIAKVGYEYRESGFRYSTDCGDSFKGAFSAGSYSEDDPRNVAELQPANGTVYTKGGGGDAPVTCTPSSTYFKNPPSVSCAAGYSPVSFEESYIGSDGDDDGGTCGGGTGGDGFQSRCSTYYCKKD